MSRHVSTLLHSEETLARESGQELLPHRQPKQAQMLGPNLGYPFDAGDARAHAPGQTNRPVRLSGDYAAGFPRASIAGGYGASVHFPVPRKALQSAKYGRPLKVIHVSQYMVRAGIEIWLKALLRGCDPNRLTFKRCVVASTMSDPSVIREMPVTVEVGQEASVRRAAQDCDVLLVSGPADVADWLGPIRPPLCVFVSHGHSPWAQAILQRCAPVVDHVVAVSKAVSRGVCNGFPNSVIYNGIDTSHLSCTAGRDEIRARFGFGPEDFVLGSVMRLSSEKRPERLIEAIAMLPRRYKLLLVGWGALQQKLLHLANEIAPLRCAITSAAGNLGDYYGALDAFCLPSEAEGFGLATLEAMFCGVPVITTNTGFAPELLVDRVHYVQCDGEAESIAGSIHTLAEHPQWAAGLAASGRDAARQFGFSWRMCREYEDLLARLWQDRAASRGEN